MQSRISTLKILFPVSCIVLLSACGAKEEHPLPPATPQKAPDIQASLKVEAPSSPIAPSAGVTAPPPAAPQAADLSSMQRPINDQGNPMSDLELLNHLVHQVNESRAAGPEIKQMQFKTEAEQSAYEAAQRQKQGPVKDLNELVAAKVIKALPTAPAGKRYAIDATSGKVVLQ